MKRNWKQEQMHVMEHEGKCSESYGCQKASLLGFDGHIV